MSAPEAPPTDPRKAAQAEAAQRRNAAIDLARSVLAAWRHRITFVTAATLALLLGLLATPLLALGLLPGLAALVNPIVSGLLTATILAVALPAGHLLARLAIPRRWDALLAEEARNATGETDAARPVDPVAEAGRELAAVLDRQRPVVDFRNTVADFALHVTRWHTGLGPLVAAAGAMLVATGFTPSPLPLPLGLVVGPGFALLFAGTAAFFPFPTVLQPPDEAEEETPEEEAPPAPDRLTGGDLLDALRHAPAWQRQGVREDTLRPAGWVLADGDDTRQRLQQRFPRLAVPSTWRTTGLDRFTRSQAEALRLLLDGDRPDALPTDLVFSGWPGAGRATVANLWSLGTLLHREGTIHCLSAENPDRAADPLDHHDDHGSARSAIAQLQGWVDTLRAAGQHAGTLATAFSDDETPLDMGARPDLLFTDVQVLADRLLADVRGDTLRFLSRLRTLVIDHPDRLQRHELASLRIAIARLRLLAEMHGHPLRVIVLLPRLDNGTELAQWLLGNARVETVEFRGRYDEAHLLSWLPPLERVHDDTQPVFVRADFEHQVQELLAELALQAHRLGQHREGTLRIGVLDHRALLGPEVRRKIWLRCEQVLQDDAAGRDVRLRHRFHFLSAADLATDAGHAYDLLLTLGIGPTPDRLVMNLRGTLRPHGALLLLADSSPEDLAAIRTLHHGEFDPTNNVDPASLHSILLPRLADPVIEHQLASLFDDFGAMGVPRDRVEALFASETVPALLDRWIEEERLLAFEAFRPRPGDPRPARTTWLRRAQDSRLAEHFQLPWGCSTRRTLQIWSDAAATQGAFTSRREVTAFVDADRLFIDLFPGAQLRHNPSSVEVGSAEGDFDDETDAGDPDRPGRLRLRQPDQSSLRLSRRALRTRLQVLHERPLAPLHGRPARRPTAPPPGDPPPASPSDPTTADDSGALPHPHLAAALHTDAAGRHALAPHLTPWMRHRHAPLRVSSGVWALRLREGFRDVVATDSRLVEAPGFVTVVRDGASLSGAVPRRAYETTALSLFFTLEEDASGAADEALRAAFHDRAAWHGLARALALILRQRYLLFDGEFGVDLVRNAGGGVEAEGSGRAGAPAEVRAGGGVEAEGSGRAGAPAEVRRPGGGSGAGAGGAALAAPWRIVLRSRHAAQVQAIGLLDTLRDHFATTLLPRLAAHLAECPCTDGCPACVAGLGTATRADLEAGGLDPMRWTQDDLVSRKGALALVGGLLGRSTGAGREVPPPAVTAGELQRLVGRIAGQEADGWRGGELYRVFGELLHPGHLEGGLPEVRWMAEEEFARRGHGVHFDAAAGVIALRGGRPEEELLDDLFHAFVHAWQVGAPARFDLERLVRGEGAGYLGGRMVVEGHALWAEQKRRLTEGNRPVMEERDAARWQACRPAVTLFEALERAVGTDGVFAWLAPFTVEHGLPEDGVVPGGGASGRAFAAATVGVGEGVPAFPGGDGVWDAGGAGAGGAVTVGDGGGGTGAGGAAGPSGIREAGGVPPQPSRSLDPRLRVPFTLHDAVAAFGLVAGARGPAPEAMRVDFALPGGEA